jgi:phosphatidylserine decarboxylase
MPATQATATRLEARPLPANVRSTQPGGGWALRLELAWGRMRRRWLRVARPRYVERMREARLGECPGCTHDVIDDRDLKFFRNVCGYHFAPGDVPRRWIDRVPIAPAGRCEALLYGGGLAISAVAAAWLSPFAAVAPAVLALFVVAFFRDPQRTIPGGRGLIVSPADGVVTDVEELDAVPFWDGPAVKVGIYLSVFNVHVNRVPQTARVVEVRYEPGRFLDTATPEAARVNENCWVLFECEDAPHHLVAVKQIAGTFASACAVAARCWRRSARDGPAAGSSDNSCLEVG